MSRPSPVKCSWPPGEPPQPLLNSRTVAMPLPSPVFPSVFTWTSHDLFRIEDLLSDSERAVRDRVRAFGEAEILPVINDYWERGELPVTIIKRFGELDVAGGQIGGYGCPGMTPVAEGLVAMEL